MSHTSGMKQIRYTDKRGGAYTREELINAGQWSEIYQKPLFHLTQKEKQIQLKSNKKRSKARTRAIRKFGEVNINNPRR